jgi:hypothetical protein
MNRTIISHDTDKGIARIRFDQDGVVHEDTYDLVKVIPGTELTLKRQNVAFTVDIQNNVIDKLASWMQKKFDSNTVPESLSGNNPS